jgi:RHS repeat-associated protein
MGLSTTFMAKKTRVKHRGLSSRMFWVLMLIGILAAGEVFAIQYVNTGNCTIFIRWRIRLHSVNQSTCEREGSSYSYWPRYGGSYTAYLQPGQSVIHNVTGHSCAIGNQPDGIVVDHVTTPNGNTFENVTLPLSHVPNDTKLFFDCNGFVGASIPTIDDAGDRLPDKDCPDAQGMPVWRVSEPYVSLWLIDEPLGYQPAIGDRVSLRLSYKQRETVAGFDTNTFSFGKSWNSSWFSFVTQATNGATSVYFPGGGKTVIEGWVDYATRTRVAGSTNTGFTVIFPDGRTNLHHLIVTNNSGAFQRAFLTESRNASGQKTRFVYEDYDPLEPVVRLKFVIDGDGRTNTITYATNHLFSTNLIAAVTDPFGRAATMEYDHQGLLTNITDTIQLATSFSYDGNGRVSQMLTPYGPTEFAYTEATSTNVAPHGRSVLVSLPDGGKELFLAQNSAPGIPASYPTNEVPTTGTFANTFDNTDLHLRNTFHWNRRQYVNLSTTNVSNLSSNDFQKARLKHWLKFGAIGTSETLSMLREASPDGFQEGQKIWYDYLGKTDSDAVGGYADPLFTATVLPDETTRFTRTERNGLGNTTSEIATYSGVSGVALRTNRFIYAANMMDLIRVTNSMGVRVLSNAYNNFRQVLETRNASNELTRFTYNTNQQLTSVRLPTGLITTNIYGADGFVSEVRVTGVSTNAFTYSNNLVHTHTDARNLTVTNTYDALQRLTRVDFPDGTFITNSYDKLDLVRTVDRMGFTNSFGYNAVRQLVAGTNALGHFSLYDYCSCGSLNWVRDAGNNYSWFFYDNAGRQTNVVYADGYAVTNHFDQIGQLVRVTDSAGSSVTNWFNNQGLLVTSSNAFGRLNLAIYDVLDRVTNSVDVNGVTLTNTYDNLNRLLTRGYPDGGVERWRYTANYPSATSYTNQLGSNVVNYAYDLLGRKTNEVYVGISTNKYAYTAAGDLRTLTDGKNQVTTWNYDEYGRVTNKLDAASNEIFRFAYDPNGRLTNRWTPAKGNTAYTFDAVGNLQTIHYPLDPAVHFSYDFLNRLTNLVDAVGTNRYTYDAIGQLLTEDGPWASDTLTYTYANRLRQSLSLQQPSGVWTNGYAYDAMKRLTNLTSAAGAFGYQYPGSQPSSLVTRLGLPGGSYITNSYDSVTRLLNTSLKTSGDVVRNAHSYGYNLAGQRTVLTNTAGDYRNFTYDNAGQLKTALGYEADATPRANEQLGYRYDPAGNLNFRTNHAFVQTFNVDNRNQLTTLNRSGTLTVAGNTTTAATNVTVNGLTADRYADLTYARTNFPLVDATTNFTAIAASSNGLWDTNAVTVDLRATNTFVYDLNGNLRTNGSQILEYDDENRLVTNYVAGAWKGEFVYDGANRCRIQRDYKWDAGTSGWSKTNEVRLFYDGVAVIQERDGNNTPVVSYSRTGSSPLARTDHASSSHAYYHTDGNLNVTVLVNGNQLIVAKYLYDPFGNTLAINGPLAEANAYRFASQRYHGNSGLVLYLRRAYSPSLQRFVNRDPIAEDGGLNLHGFVNNNPISFQDPLGLAPGFFANFYSSVASHGMSDAGKFLGHIGQTFWNAGVQQYGSGFINPYAMMWDMSVGLVNSVDVASQQWAKLAYDPCEGERFRRAVLDWITSPEGIADSTLFIESLLAGGLVSPQPVPQWTQMEFNFVKGDLSGKLTSWTAAAKGLPKTRDALHIDLRNKGFEYKSTSPNGYVTYKGPDGQTVTIKPSGEVIPTQRVPKADGSGKFPQRQDYNGNPLPDQSHSTGHFVEPLADILPKP